MKQPDVDVTGKVGKNTEVKTSFATDADEIIIRAFAFRTLFKSQQKSGLLR